MKIRQILFQMLFTSLGTLAIMLTLRPFGVPQVDAGYICYSIGVAVLVMLAYGGSLLMLRYLLHWRNENLALSSGIFMLIMVVILNVLLTSFESLYFDGSISAKWTDNAGNLSFAYFLKNFFYILPISIVIGGLVFFIERNKQLRINLREAMEMNEALRVRQQAAERIETQTNTNELVLEALTGRERLTFTSPADVLYIESDANYVNVFFCEAEKVQRKTLRTTMRSIEDQLANRHDIVRCHRAYFVNLSHVRRVSGNSQGYRLSLDTGDTTVPVSRQYATDIYNLVQNSEL